MNREEIYNMLIELSKQMRNMQANYQQRAEKESLPGCSQAYSEWSRIYSSGCKDAFAVCANLLEDTVKKIAKQ